MEEQVITIIKENIESDQHIDVSTNLKSDLDIDSFDLLMIVDALEDEFSVTIEESDMEKVTYVSDIVTMLKNYHRE